MALAPQPTTIQVTNAGDTFGDQTFGGGLFRGHLSFDIETVDSV